MLALDTCVIVDILRGEKPHYALRLQEAEDAGERIVISSLVLHELSYGALLSARPEVQLGLVDAFVDRAQLEPWTADDAMAAARVRADLGRGTADRRMIDSLLAGQAVNRSWKLATSNVKDFIRVPELTVIDWSDPAGAREIDPQSWIAARLQYPFKEVK